MDNGQWTNYFTYHLQATTENLTPTCNLKPETSPYWQLLSEARLYYVSEKRSY